jgi:Skp family chaperone for outer membrane proteins
LDVTKTLDSHTELARKLADLEERFESHDEQIQAIFEAIRQLMAPFDKKVKKIGFTAREKQKAYGKDTKN